MIYITFFMMVIRHIIKLFDWTERIQPLLVPMVCSLLVGYYLVFVNALITLSKCIKANFADLVKNIIEVFMDKFSDFGSSFTLVYANFEFKRCVGTNIVLN